MTKIIKTILLIAGALALVVLAFVLPDLAGPGAFGFALFGMAALTKDRNSPTKHKQRVIHCKVNGGSKIYAGALTAWDADGYLRPMSDAAGLTVAGRAEAMADNTAGADGAVEVDVAIGVFSWEVSAALEALGQAAVGTMVFGVDDQTVGLSSDTANDTPVGLLEEIDAQGRYWVSTGRRFDDETLGALAALDSVGAAEIDAGAVGTSELANAVADAIPGAPGIAIAAEGGDEIVVTVQAKDIQGNNLAARQLVTWWLSDAALGAPSGDPPSAGTAVTTGVALKEHTADVYGEAMTDAAGVLALTLGEAGVDTWFLNVAIGGTVTASAAITFA